MHIKYKHVVVLGDGLKDYGVVGGLEILAAEVTGVSKDPEVLLRKRREINHEGHFLADINYILDEIAWPDVSEPEKRWRMWRAIVLFFDSEGTYIPQRDKRREELKELIYRLATDLGGRKINLDLVFEKRKKGKIRAVS